MATQTGKFYSFYLTLRLSLTSLYYTGKASILSYFKRLSNKESTKIIKNFAYYILKPLKINFIYKNWEILKTLPKDRAVILMSNHSSLYDIPILLHTVPNNINLRMLAKVELARIPIFGKGMLNLGFPTVNRQDRQQALKDLEHTKTLMRNGITLWAAPEGTRSHDGSLLKFKKGVFMMAIELDAIIIPIGINGADKVLPAKSRKYSLNETVTLTVGKPLDTKNYNLEDRDVIIQNVREEIAKAMS